MAAPDEKARSCAWRPKAPFALAVAWLCVVPYAGSRAFAQPTAEGNSTLPTPLPPVAPPPAAASCVDRGPAVALELAKHRQHLPRHQAHRTARALCHEAERVRLDPLLLLAVIGVESSFNPRAVSPVGAEGLMQLMPHTARYLAARANLAWSQRVAFDPAINIRIGTRYLATLRDAFHGRMDWALTAYNRGPTATHHLLRAHHGLPHAVHAAYSMRVLRAYDHLKRQYPATSLVAMTPNRSL